MRPHRGRREPPMSPPGGPPGDQRPDRASPPSGGSGAFLPISNASTFSARSPWVSENAAAQATTPTRITDTAATPTAVARIGTGVGWPDARMADPRPAAPLNAGPTHLRLTGSRSRSSCLAILCAPLDGHHPGIADLISLIPPCTALAKARGSSGPSVTGVPGSGTSQGFPR
jgi:hypothetical protein